MSKRKKYNQSVVRQKLINLLYYFAVGIKVQWIPNKLLLFSLGFFSIGRITDQKGIYKFWQI